ncbi:MAG: DUF1993 domain-containing protein [Pseudomonadota bacterium]
MPISLYQASVPAFVRGLTSLAAVLEKAKTHAAANNIDLQTFVDARLAPDMLTLAGQVQATSDGAKFGAARLARVTPPSFADTESTFAELEERIAKTLAFITTVTEAQINASEGGSVTLKLGGKERTFNSEPYLLGFVLPNFYFHVTTAYDILRNQGVPLVKMDYIGALPA